MGEFEDRFELLTKVGGGGMGDVYRARDRRTGADVAVKLVASRALREYERFAQEGRILANVESSRIVKYVAHGTAGDGRPFLAMEWLAGTDLDAYLGRGPLPLHEAMAIGRGVAEGLAELHKHGIIHRDLKPSNLFVVDGDPQKIKIVDFGIARIIGFDGTTKTGALVGTPGYMSPEQARGGRAVTPAADVFALGCVLYECLAGRPAFQSENIAALLAKILFEAPRRLLEFRSDIPVVVEDVIEAMLAKDPSERPPDGAAVVELLGAISVLPPAPAATPGVTVSPRLGEDERRVASLVIASPPAGEHRSWPPGDFPFPSASSGTSDLEYVDGIDRTESDALSLAEDIAATHQATATKLADGSILFSITGRATAANQAQAAARLSLRVARSFRSRRVALATGFVAMAVRPARADGSSPPAASSKNGQGLGPILDRLARLLSADRRSEAKAADTGLLAPVLDETTAHLLTRGRLSRDESRDPATLDPSQRRKRRGSFELTAGTPDPDRDPRHAHYFLSAADESSVTEGSRSITTMVSGVPPAASLAVAAEESMRPWDPNAAEFFVGRQRELAALEGALSELVAEEVSRVVCVTGGAGVGKTRLTEEFFRRVAQNSSCSGEPALRILRACAVGNLLTPSLDGRRRGNGSLGQSFSGGSRSGEGNAPRAFAGIPLQVIADLIRRACDIHDDDPLTNKCDKLMYRVVAVLDGADAAGVAEFLGEVIGASFPADDSPELTAARVSPRLMADLIEDAFVRFVSAEAVAARAASEIATLFVDDVHAADPASLRLLERAVFLATAPLLVVFSGREFPRRKEADRGISRSEAESGLRVGDLFHRHPRIDVPVGPLPKKAAARLLAAHLDARADDATGAPVAPVSADVQERLLMLAEGNAFFLGELAREPLAALSGNSTDVSLVAVLEARFAGLSPEARRLLRVASLFGDSAPEGGLRALLPSWDPPAISQLIDHLTQRDLLQVEVTVGSPTLFHAAHDPGRAIEDFPRARVPDDLVRRRNSVGDGQVFEPDLVRRRNSVGDGQVFEPDLVRRRNSVGDGQVFEPDLVRRRNGVGDGQLLASASPRTRGSVADVVVSELPGKRESGATAPGGAPTMSGATASPNISEAEVAQKSGNGVPPPRPSASSLRARRGEDAVSSLPPSSDPRPRAVRFRHPLLREAAYATLVDRDRSEGHRWVGEYLSRRPGVPPAVIADHFVRADLPARAVAYYANAARDALAANAFATARALGERAIEICTTKPRSPSPAFGSASDAPPEPSATVCDPTVRCDIHLLLTEVGRWSGDAELRAHHASVAFDLASPGSPAFHEAAGEIAEAAAARGDRTAIFEIALRAPVEPLHPVTLRGVLGAARVVERLLGAGDLDAIQRLYRLEYLAFRTEDPMALAPPGIDPAGLDAVLAGARCLRAQYNDSVDQQLEALLPALRHYEEIRDVRHACGVRLQIGMTLLRVGMDRAAEEAFQRTLDQALALGLRRIEQEARMRLGFTAARLGRIEEARLVLTPLVNWFGEAGMHPQKAITLGYLAILGWFTGDFAQMESDALRGYQVLTDSLPAQTALLALLIIARSSLGDVTTLQADCTALQGRLASQGHLLGSDELGRLALIEGAAALGNTQEAERLVRAAAARIRVLASAISHPDYRHSFLEVVRSNVRILERERENDFGPRGW